MERISYNEVPEDFLKVLLQVQQYVDRSGLENKLLDLIKFRVSQINNCAYCIDMHYKEATQAGETPLRLISLSAWRETPYYSQKEQAVLAFAELLTKMPSDENSDHVHDELAKHFTKAEIACLTLAVIQINSWNRLVRSFGTVPGNYKVQSKAALV
ncbi:MAG: carboxymuconolactone decarboxylase family protein [Chitinophagaceae bacterium]